MSVQYGSNIFPVALAVYSLFLAFTIKHVTNELVLEQFIYSSTMLILRHGSHQLVECKIHTPSAEAAVLHMSVRVANCEMDQMHVRPLISRADGLQAERLRASARIQKVLMLYCVIRSIWEQLKTQKAGKVDISGPAEWTLICGLPPKEQRH